MVFHLNKYANILRLNTKRICKSISDIKEYYTISKLCQFAIFDAYTGNINSFFCSLHLDRNNIMPGLLHVLFETDKYSN